ncbi:DUF1634 domain-containing protein [Pedobacter jamesrossensis]|uniref:DUF1634 domain-containing protein n=1 Tax=Pedobacter jamesrossensis TaxID=1908238 RepID=A0ABV8NJ56_9SPHI
MKKLTKNGLQAFIGNALRIGVITSFSFILFGGISYLIAHGSHFSDFTSFKIYTVPLKEMFKGVLSLNSKSIIQLGIIILIATPIMRVVFSAISFALAKDILYTGITLLVLLIIAFSMISGYTG